MDTRRNTRRELAVLATALVIASRPLEGDLVWLVGGLVLGAVVLGGLQALDLGEPRGVAIESVITPAVASVAALGAIRLVPVGLWLVPAIILAFVLIDRALAAEANLLARPGGEPAPEDRNALLAVVLTSAFLAFAGAAGAAGVIAPLGTDATAPVSESSLLVLVVADATIAALLGFRLALLDTPSVRDALWGAITFAAVAAIGTATVRAIDLPRLIGPAVVTLLLYLWSAYLRRPQGFGGERRRLAEGAVLALLGLVVAGWNLLLRA
jgi:hypothetical protein